MLKIGRCILANIENEVNINKKTEGKILLTLLNKLSNIGDKLKIIVISAKLNIKITITIVNKCNIFIGSKNANIIYIPIAVEKVIFSGFIAILSLDFFIVC